MEVEKIVLPWENSMKKTLIHCFVLLILTATILLTTELFITPLSHAATFDSTIAHNGPYGPDTCLNGYVWRDAFDGDHVCVTPQQRTQTAYDNGQAPYRVNPNGGPYGPDTCRNGYVWRDAFANDHVCVTPQQHTQAADDNSQAPYRYQETQIDNGTALNPVND